VLGFGTGHRRSIAALRKFFAATAGVALVPSSFYGSFDEHTVRFLRAARRGQSSGSPSPPGPCAITSPGSRMSASSVAR
jgi:hypothetical protein